MRWLGVLIVVVGALEPLGPVVRQDGFQFKPPKSFRMARMDLFHGTQVGTISVTPSASRYLSAALIDGDTDLAPRRIRVLRRGEGAGGENPAPWESLGPAAPGSRIDFVRYQIPPSTVLGPSPAHASGTFEHMHVAIGTVRVTVGDETAELVAGDGCTCRADAPHGVENTDPFTEALIYLIVERL